MSHTVIENPVTRERGIVRRTPNDAGSMLIADLYAAPRAAVAGEHVHPRSTECFTVVRGELHLRLDGAVQAVEPGTCSAWPATGGPMTTAGRAAAAGPARPGVRRRHPLRLPTAGGAASASRRPRAHRQDARAEGLLPLLPGQRRRGPCRARITAGRDHRAHPRAAGASGRSEVGGLTGVGGCSLTEPISRFDRSPFK
jgi:Cupin domain